MAAVNFTDGLFQAQDDNGRPLIGGKLYTYENGTTTPAVTYTDQAGTQPNTNPVVLDARGEAKVYLDPDQLYTFVLKDRNDALVWSLDGVSGTTSSVDFRDFKSKLAQASDPLLLGFMQLGTGAILRTMLAKAREIPSLQDFGAVGDGVANDSVAIQKAFDSGREHIFILPGRYKCTERIVIPRHMCVWGASRELSIFDFSEHSGDCLALEGTSNTQTIQVNLRGFKILTGEDTQDALTLYCAKGGIISDFQVTTGGGKRSAGNAITFKAYSYSTRVENAILNYAQNGVHIRAFQDDGVTTESGKANIQLHDVNIGQMEHAGVWNEPNNVGFTFVNGAVQSCDYPVIIDGGRNGLLQSIYTENNKEIDFWFRGAQSTPAGWTIIGTRSSDPAPIQYKIDNARGLTVIGGQLYKTEISDTGSIDQVVMIGVVDAISNPITDPGGRLIRLSGTTTQRPNVAGSWYRTVKNGLSVEGGLHLGGDSRLTGLVVSSSISWNPGTVTSGASAWTDITVAGAQVGDFVQVTYGYDLPGGAVIYGRVRAADTVRVTLINMSGSSLSTGTNNLRVTLLRGSAT